MRELFRFLSIFDWVMPLISLADDLANDPTLLSKNSWSFFVPYGESIESGWNATDIDELLKKHGIKTYGKLYVPYSPDGEEYCFTVPLTQARFAEYVLLKNNVPLTENSMGAPGKKSFLDW